MGKKRVIAETGAGQHGVATATAAALMGLECAVFMGVEDIRRQALNVYKMRLLGAEVVPVDEGTGTLADAVTAALRHWVERVEDTFYVLGQRVGPHPYPMMVREFQKRHRRRDHRSAPARRASRSVDAVVACVGGGSNAIGTFYPFVMRRRRVRRLRCSSAPRPRARASTPTRPARRSRSGTPGVMHGFYSYLLQDEAGNPLEAYSISAGLDYPGVGPEHAYLNDEGLVRYEAVTDAEALAAFEQLVQDRGHHPGDRDRATRSRCCPGSPRSSVRTRRSW